MFEIGKEYERRELLAFVGSRQLQSGILWGDYAPDCVIVTSGGKHSKRAGYEDKVASDGSWIYFGQGTTGDQDPKRKANRLLVEGIRSVLLFTTRERTSAEIKYTGNRSKLWCFEGIFGVRKWEEYVPALGERAGDKLLLFHLAPVKETYSSVFDSLTDSEPEDSYIHDRELALSQLKAKLSKKETWTNVGFSSVREYRRASSLTRSYALLRANGICEYCEAPAPFLDKYGTPFLEVHHIFRLADDGPDSPENVAALCPNCHKQAHFGSEKDNFRRCISQRILSKEI